jgi:putative redox protein
MSGPVTARSGKTIRVDIDAGGHRLIADEPVDAGGTGAGPTPYDNLSAGLAACTSMTLQIVARRENIPLEGLEMTVLNDRMYAKDCADCASASGYIHRFTIEVRLLGDLSDAQRKRLQDVAARCPVSKTLTSEIKIDEVFV